MSGFGTGIRANIYVPVICDGIGIGQTCYGSNNSFICALNSYF